jgi:molybdopterin-guanine dinucleotide biosynthesis protein A
MQGIASGLAAVADHAPLAFVCSTDLPFLHPAFVAAVLRFLFHDREADIALPVAQGFRQPLAAGYRTEMFSLIEQRVAEGDLRPGMLFEHCRVEQLDDAELLADPTLARLDPDLESVLNVNDLQEYIAAREQPAPEVVVERFGALAINGFRGPHVVRAATLGDAAAETGLSLDRHVLAALNGDEITRDPELPLVMGDTVSFLTADGGG